MSAKATILLGIVLVARSCLPPKTVTVAGRHDADALIRAVLQRALVDAKDLPDLNLVDAGAEIVIRSDIPGGPYRIDAKAAPKVPGKSVLILPSDELKRRAIDHGDVYYVAVDGLTITADTAELTIGAAMETAPVRPVLCCCHAVVRYARVRGVWTYQTTTGAICS